MTHLVVLGLNSRDDAERVLEVTDDLAKQQLLQREDAAIAYKDSKGKVRIQQTMNLTGAGAAGGALWGTLLGLIFLNPLAGFAVGAASGAIAGKLTDIGINDSFMKDLGATLTAGTAALFVLVRKSTPDKVLEGLRPFAGKGRVLQTSLTNDKEDELRKLMEGL